MKTLRTKWGKDFLKCSTSLVIQYLTRISPIILIVLIFRITPSKTYNGEAVAVQHVTLPLETATSHIGRDSSPSHWISDQLPANGAWGSISLWFRNLGCYHPCDSSGHSLAQPWAPPSLWQPWLLWASEWECTRKSPLHSLSFSLPVSLPFKSMERN